MENWWSFGEHSGLPGRDLAIYQITCPFCMTRGNFTTIHHAEKKHHCNNKVLNFDTLECGNCKGYVMVFWSASSTGGHQGIHQYRILPWPLKLDKYPDHWPDAIGRFWLQAKQCLGNENWDATAVMARSALQSALRSQNAAGNNLKQEIDNLAEKGILPPLMKDWADNVRELGNDSAHPKPEQKATDPQDARDVVQFLDFLLRYLYDLPQQIQEYRERTASE